MAKLTDLKELLQAARSAHPARGPEAPPPAGAVPGAGASRAAAAAPGAGASRSAAASAAGASRASVAAPGASASRPHVALPAKHAGSARRAIAAAKHAAGDVDLAQAFADVQRLRPPNRAIIERPRPAPVAAQREEDERDALEMSKYGAEPAPHTWEIGQEHEAGQTFLRPGLGSDVLSKLRRGRWSVQAELDLHGLTAEQSRDTLADFLLESRARGLRCVRVIHGKGLTSPNREPVLKGKVRQWLSHWDDVLAYCEAPRHAGGGGAVMILLRGAKGG